MRARMPLLSLPCLTVSICVGPFGAAHRCAPRPGTLLIVESPPLQELPSLHDDLPLIKLMAALDARAIMVRPASGTVMSGADAVRYRWCSQRC